MIRPCSSLCFLLPAAAILLLHHIPLLAAAAVSVEDTCKVAVSRNPTISYGFCVDIIRFDPHGASANTTESIASIAVSMASHAAESGSGMIHGLLRGGRGPVDDAKTKRALKFCKAKYHGLSSMLADAQRAIGGGEPGSAKKYMRAVVDVPNECEKRRAIAKWSLWSPMTDMNSNTKRVVTLAFAITNLL